MGQYSEHTCIYRAYVFKDVRCSEDVECANKQIQTTDVYTVIKNSNCNHLGLEISFNKDWTIWIKFGVSEALDMQF